MSLGLGLQQYTALVLFADEDIDFIQEMVEKLEEEYGLKVSSNLFHELSGWSEMATLLWTFVVGFDLYGFTVGLINYIKRKNNEIISCVVNVPGL